MGVKKPSNKKSFKSSAKSSANFEKKVLAVIDKKVEVKHVQPSTFLDTNIYNILNNPTGQCVSLMPFIGQGDGQGARVGNSVDTRKVMLHMNARVHQIDAAGLADPPKYIDIYIFKFKKSNVHTALELANFLQWGNTSQPYDSLLRHESGGLQINRDKYVLKKHIRRLLWNPKATNVYQGARDLQQALSIKMDITKYYKKRLLFDDEVSNTITNDNLYITCVYTNQNREVYANATSVGQFDTTMMYSFDDM